jgi:hypothetical protein
MTTIIEQTPVVRPKKNKQRVRAGKANLAQPILSDTAKWSEDADVRRHEQAVAKAWGQTALVAED